MKNMIWFRADLRLTDNTAFTQALAKADEVIALYIITEKTWQRHDTSANKVQFTLQHLQSVSDELYEKHGIPLLIKQTDYFSECDTIIKQLCQQHDIENVYCNAQYELDERRRDGKAKKTLQAIDVNFHCLHDQCVLAPGEVFSQKNEPLKVFTPFKITWLQVAYQQQAFIASNKPRKQFKSAHKPSKVPNSLKAFVCNIDLSAWPTGEEAAKKRLQTFCKNKISDYQQERDFPAIDGTSQLSAYLAIGAISPRQCIQAIMKGLNTDNFHNIQKNNGAATWLSELIWRDFYKHVAFHFSYVFFHKPFNPKMKNIPWRKSQKLYDAWRAGKTGFPLVDAAMRQLQQTGWMHNRLRMVVAMFFSKTLFLDWRLGEKHFMEHLIDGDFSANNGGWQWSSSTGTDAAPYFRIFNPTTQSERFDPDGSFIRQYVPELKDVTGKAIHAPGDAYIKPIVDYKAMRNEVIAAFKENS